MLYRTLAVTSAIALFLLTPLRFPHTLPHL